MKRPLRGNGIPFRGQTEGITCGGFTMTMNRQGWTNDLLGASLVVALALACSCAQTAPGGVALPPEIEAALNRLKAAAWDDDDMGFGSGGAMESHLRRNKPFMRPLLEYAKVSDHNLEGLAEYVLASQMAFARRFAPGSHLDNEVVTRTTYDKGSEPEYGLSIEAYLLLQMAELRGSASFLRRVLTVLHEVVVAMSYLAEQQILHRQLVPPQEIEKTTRERGVVLTTPGAQIAWYCEQFMTRQAVFSSGYLPETALAVVANYQRWRGRTATVRFTMLHQHTTMSYVKALAEALPESRAGEGPRK
ncbi:MAG: hypothetical protein COZ57_30580 [Armatimonadetes bacterium CG_4_8_14_3_um_filter_66_20]|nr:MAG: hypothetical protein COZ57_30580 [Armatimonadetes bacterium CG_4_8_14_3_um_filter_66_20]